MGVSAAGDITLVDIGPLNTSQIAILTTDASTQTVSLTASAGGLTVDAVIGEATDNLTLIATSGSVNDSGVVVTANRLTVEATTGVGLNTNVDSINVVNGSSGNVTITETDDVTIAGINQTSSGDISVNAGGSINVDNGGVGDAISTTAAGTVTIQATGATSDLTINSTVRSDSGQITLNADDDVSLAALARVINMSNVVGSVAVTADADGDSTGSLSFSDSAFLATNEGQIGGAILNSATPISGVQIGELLGGNQRRADIQVQVNDSLGSGFEVTIDWLEGDPLSGDPLRLNPLPGDISQGGVGVSFAHLYDEDPNQGTQATDINVEVQLTNIANGSIVLMENSTNLLDRSEFSTIVTLGVEGAIFPFAPPLPTTETIDFVRTVVPTLVNPPTFGRFVFVTAPQQINNSVGSTVETTQRYYVLRIVTFGAEGEVKLWRDDQGDGPRQEAPLPDMEDPNSDSDFELSQLPELFKRLPNDRYRIYMIEGETERLVLDFIIRDGQPIEAQSEDQPAEPVEPAEPEDSDASPELGQKEIDVEVSAERTDLSAIERLGSVPIVSAGGVLLAAGMTKPRSTDARNTAYPRRPRRNSPVKRKLA